MIPQALQPPEEYRAIAEGIVQNADGIHQFLTACEDCGLPVQERREALNGHVAFAKSFLRSFFPDSPHQ